MNPKWIIPASFFGIVLGLVGLGDCWRAAGHAWGLPDIYSVIVMSSGFVVWAILAALYIAKWIWATDEALAELRHPVQSCFIGLTGVATMLAAIAIYDRYGNGPHWHALGITLFVIGAVLQIGYGILFTSRQWTGDRDLGAVSAAIYLPTVAGNFVAAFAAGFFGYPGLGKVFLGVGLFSWLALESVITKRLGFHNAMAKPLRPTMGIMLAPPVVGCIGYLFVTGGPAGPRPDLFAQALFGYGLFVLLVLVAMFPWIAQQSFSASYWAFSFGITAVAFDAIVFVIRGQTGYINGLAVCLFVFANIAIGILVLGTLWRLVTGALVPPPLNTTPGSGV